MRQSVCSSFSLWKGIYKFSVFCCNIILFSKERYGIVVAQKNPLYAWSPAQFGDFFFLLTYLQAGVLEQYSPWTLDMQHQTQVHTLSVFFFSVVSRRLSAVSAALWTHPRTLTTRTRLRFWSGLTAWRGRCSAQARTALTPSSSGREAKHHSSQPPVSSLTTEKGSSLTCSPEQSSTDQSKIVCVCEERERKKMNGVCVRGEFCL